MPLQQLSFCTQTSQKKPSGAHPSEGMFRKRRMYEVVLAKPVSWTQ